MSKQLRNERLIKLGPYTSEAMQGRGEHDESGHWLSWDGLVRHEPCDWTQITIKILASFYFRQQFLMLF